MVADLYLGYRLGASLPGVHEPRPPEPCPQLPLAACRVRPADPRPASVESFRVGEFVPTWTPAEHAAAVEEVRAAIGRGDVYQVNLVQHLWASFQGSPAALETALAPLDAPWAHALHGDGWSIVSATPELFLQTRGDRARTMPIKGTRPADAGEPIAESSKDRAEHVMIVDLERNDLSRVCVPGSVRWPELLSERQLAGVTHLVATVEGEASTALFRLRSVVFAGDWPRTEAEAA